jgi:hypothetical protein
MIAETNGSDVIVAIITCSGAMVGAILGLIGLVLKLRRENRIQHADNKSSITNDMSALSATLGMVHDEVKTTRTELRDDIHRVHERLNDHIATHDRSVVEVMEQAHPTSSTASRPRRRKTA